MVLILFYSWLDCSWVDYCLGVEIGLFLIWRSRSLKSEILVDVMTKVRVLWGVLVMLMLDCI